MMPNNNSTACTFSNQEIISLPIEQSDRFFSRLSSSKEKSTIPSMVAPAASFRVLYYRGETVANIPFMWESKPGTPKHTCCRLDDDHDILDSSSTIIPPLTPPPSYHSTTMLIKKRGRRSNYFLNNYLPKFMAERAGRLLISSSSSCATSSYSGSSSPTDSSSWKLISTCCPSSIFRIRSRSIMDAKDNDDIA